MRHHIMSNATICFDWANDICQAMPKFSMDSVETDSVPNETTPGIQCLQSAWTACVVKRS